MWSDSSFPKRKFLEVNEINIFSNFRNLIFSSIWKISFFFFDFRSIQSMVCKLIRFVSMKFFNAEHELSLIMTSIELFPSSIYFISVIFFRSYDFLRHMISTISRFSCALSNLIKQSYNDLKSMQMIMKKKFAKFFRRSILKSIQHRNFES